MYFKLIIKFIMNKALKYINTRSKSVKIITHFYFDIGFILIIFVSIRLLIKGCSIELSLDFKKKA